MNESPIFTKNGIKLQTMGAGVVVAEAEPAAIMLLGTPAARSKGSLLAKTEPNSKTVKMKKSSIAFPRGNKNWDTVTSNLSENKIG